MTWITLETCQGPVGYVGEKLSGRDAGPSICTHLPFLFLYYSLQPPPPLLPFTWHFHARNDKTTRHAQTGSEHRQVPGEKRGGKRQEKVSHIELRRLMLVNRSFFFSHLQWTSPPQKVAEIKQIAQTPTTTTGSRCEGRCKGMPLPVREFFFICLQ